jgi:hypothetical protein
LTNTFALIKNALYRTSISEVVIHEAQPAGTSSTGSTTSIPHNMDSVTTTSTRLFNDKFGTRATTSHPHINDDITMKLYQ